MPGFSLEFTRRYCMAHRLLAGLAPKCAFPHGHNEYVRVRLAPRDSLPLDGIGNMVAEFGAATRMWHRWIDDAVDHAFQLSERDPLVEYFLEKEPAAIPRLLITPGDPTTECLAACFFEKLSAFLREQNSSLECRWIRISETPSNAVTLDATSASVLPTMPYVPWWRRADMSINDLRPEVAVLQGETKTPERAIQR